MSVGLSRVAVQLPRGIEAVDDVLVRSGCRPMERRMFAKVYGLRDSPTLAADERMEDLLVEAGRAALDGGPAALILYGHTLLMAEVDLCGEFPDRLRSRLGLSGSRFYGLSHINCASVLRAVELARSFLGRPGADPDERVLVLGGDQGSASDRGRFITGSTVAGDSAVGLLVHGPGAAARPRYRYLAGASGRDTRFHRNMRMPAEEFALFNRICSEQAVETLDRAARATGLAMDRLDHVMLHLSNQVFARSFSRQSGIPKDRIHLDLLAERGHNFGTDALMALQHADRTGRLRPGDRCALVAIGLGAYFQAVIVEVAEDR
ncbi:3-oxoacyl-[acyl-carrier-protein] synthase III C-terminal domain-containing protein [Streptomyces sp. SL13]|uniref:3-oxoacyl-[acyl-carrier-protein] synthase III C-terminal domain-containing protein n=1 Tax=Streptantibioticus silvisoli TaxID=2705255 RepID=A0AA90H5B1_9ACTN|nr:3-oxoacyl-[acyl-carrier-protein] synthase III C-terminal domain-containing protein [Streptantibioticus silvisoli]MDI5970924.1 3-oxoacyl-[acyl-carrier-protein] synthase III C-terminal domain-containing protein [Streptantibioticus silvisoli]